MNVIVTTSVIQFHISHCFGLFFFKHLLQLFLEAAAECCKKHNVQSTDVFLQKMIQTYEMMIVRHGYGFSPMHGYIYLHVYMFEFLCPGS